MREQHLIYPAAVYYPRQLTQRVYCILNSHGDCWEIALEPDVLARDLVERIIKPNLIVPTPQVEQQHLLSCCYSPPIERIFLLYSRRGSEEAELYQVGRFTRKEKSVFEQAVVKEMKNLLRRSPKRKPTKKKMLPPPTAIDIRSLLRVLDGGRK